MFQVRENSSPTRPNLSAGQSTLKRRSQPSAPPCGIGLSTHDQRHRRTGGSLAADRRRCQAAPELAACGRLGTDAATAPATPPPHRRRPATKTSSKANTASVDRDSQQDEPQSRNTTAQTAVAVGRMLQPGHPRMPDARIHELGCVLTILCIGVRHSWMAAPLHCTLHAPPRLLGDFGRGKSNFSALA